MIIIVKLINQKLRNKYIIKELKKEKKSKKVFDC